MSIGTRIMEIRKKNNLSQEAFGETLGVSRQAISKWEMDASIPDVEKLILLSQIYHVSVGYILGIEEYKNGPEYTMTSAMGEASEDDSNRELTPEQLKMVEEIVERYLKAIPKEAFSEKKSQIPLIMAVVSMVVCFGILLALIGSIYSVNQYIAKLERDQWDISMRQDDLKVDVMNAESEISRRLESQLQAVLEDAYNIITESAWEVIGYDQQAETFTISVYAVVKSYSETTVAEFIIVGGGHESKVTAERDGDRYTAKIICPRSSTLELKLLLTDNGVTDVKSLGMIEDQLSAYFPDWDVHGGFGLDHLSYENGVLHQEDYRLHMKMDTTMTGPMGSAKISKAQLIYYINKEKHMVIDLPLEFDEKQATWAVEFDLELPLKEGDTVADVIVITDVWGRQARKLRSACQIQNGEVRAWGLVEAEQLPE